MIGLIQLLSISLLSASLPYSSATSSSSKCSGAQHWNGAYKHHSHFRVHSGMSTVTLAASNAAQAAATTVEFSTAFTVTQKASMTISKANPPTTTSTISTTTEASATASASASTNSDNQKYVDIHNTERAKYGASDLIWNNTLATAAQTWANKCTGQHSQSTLGPFGENLASGTGDFTSAAGLQLWINEASNFSASNPTYSHWTQMVWKGTTNIGCAVSECNNLFDFATYGATQYYVCEYWPAGNVIGQFSENVQA